MPIVIRAQIGPTVHCDEKGLEMTPEFRPKRGIKARSAAAPSPTRGAAIGQH
ncbi:MAG: hypothetical protein QNJ16_05145 [Rhodobacter sp.]|nr:hypothetical protein [Rhodobacter sp.]